MFTKFAIGILVTFFVSSFAEEYYATNYGVVQFYTLQKNELAGKFTPLDKAFSLNFYSKQSNDQSMLEITEGEDNDVIISYNYKNSAGNMQIGDYQFFEYIEDNVGSAENVSRDFAFMELKGRYDLKMLEALAFALGEGVGLYGEDYPSAMSIYLAAKALITPSIPSTSLTSYTAAQCDTISGTGGCANSKTNNCTRKPVGSTCFGMCGYSDYCWSFICGDCCIHRGCCLHDICCRKSMWSYRCLILKGFTCTNFHKC